MLPYGGNSQDGGYQRVKMSRRLSEGGIVVGGVGKCLEKGCPDTAVVYF